MTSGRGKLVAILAGVLALALIAGLAGWKFFTERVDVIHLTAQFDSTVGLYPDNKVAVLGMPVGRVTQITPKNGYVEVNFTVDRDVQIPADAQAVTLSNSILTDRQIELTPAYRGGPAMKDGDTIGLNRTKTPVEFARVLDVLDKVSKSLSGDGRGEGPLRDVVDNAAAVADGNGEQIKTALGELAKALRLSADGGAQTKEQLSTVIKNISSLFDAAARNDETLREFGSTIRQLSQILADENFGSGRTGRQINEVVRQAGQIIEANRENIKAAIANGNTTLKTTVDHQRDLAEFIDVAPLLLDNFYNVVDKENSAVRVRVLTDQTLFEGQHIKEVCNMMGLRQLGCSTGTLQDFGPDFGLTYMLDGLAAMGQK